MTQKDKDLLLKDLCARLPYGVKGNYQNSDDELLRKVTIMYRYLEPDGLVMTGDIKPYLFPLSSMTEEQKVYINTNPDGVYIQIFDNVVISASTNGFDNGFDWLNAHHFDYRGLIEKGLAIDATGLNIY